MLSLLALFAEAAPSLAGEAGWVGTGLLGAVLGWLLFVHLPAKDKQFRDIVDKLLDRNDQQTGTMQQTFRDSLKDVVNHCESEFREMRATFEDKIEAVVEALKGKADRPDRHGK